MLISIRLKTIRELIKPNCINLLVFKPTAPFLLYNIVLKLYIIMDMAATLNIPIPLLRDQLRSLAGVIAVRDLEVVCAGVVQMNVILVVDSTAETDEIIVAANAIARALFRQPR